MANYCHTNLIGKNAYSAKIKTKQNLVDSNDGSNDFLNGYS